MYRSAASRLRELKGGTASTIPARFASSTAVSVRPGGGILSWLTGGSASASPSLDFPLPGVVLPPPLPDYVEPGKTKITTLPNGVKIASETSANTATSLGLYVDCGSVYENPNIFGTSHLLERMAFKSTFNLSLLRIVREVEAIGGNVQASASREQLGYTFDALKTYLPQMASLIEKSMKRYKMKSEISAASKDPPYLLLEAIHSAGYAGALANPLLAPESAVERLNASVLEKFVAEHFTGPRIVLAAYGAEHEELLSNAEPLLSDLPNVARPAEPKSKYVGGDYRCQAATETTHFALAFEVPGGWRIQKEAITLTVLQMLVGGGGSFSSGGPGKGMCSRLYLNALSKHSNIQSFSAFSSLYNHTGVFGIQASAKSSHASTSMDIAVKELISVATSGQVDQVQLDRAKHATKSALLMHLESRMVTSEDIGRQILTYGERKPVEEYLKTVDEVTLKDITSIAQKSISSPLTMASYDAEYCSYILKKD